jgi:RNA polymerase sigma-70 factor (ECF subfamily)
MAHDAAEQAGNLERFREYLALLARLQLDSRLQGKVDLSGLVQQTLLEALRASDRMSQQGEDHLARWLRRILANNLRDEIRKLYTQARNVEREQSLEAALEASSCRIDAWLVAEQSSPSHQAMRNEELLRLAAALAKLPDDQRRAVELHHLKGLALLDIAAQMRRSKGAVAALLFRGLNKLRELLSEEGNCTPQAEDTPQPRS